MWGRLFGSGKVHMSGRELRRSPNNRNVFDLGPTRTDKMPFGNTHSKAPRKPPAHGLPINPFHAPLASPSARPYCRPLELLPVAKRNPSFLVSVTTVVHSSVISASWRKI